MARLALFIGLTWMLVGRSDASASDHLMAGARLFRQGQYPEALVEFKVAEKLGAPPQVRWYIAAALVKMDRAEEAIEAFSDARKASPQTEDVLLTFYRALACYQTKLYGCADQLLEKVQTSAGPNIAAQSKQMRDQIHQLLQTTPPADAIDWYFERGRKALEAHHKALAVEYFAEVAALGRRRADCRHCEDADAELAKLRHPTRSAP